MNRLNRIEDEKPLDVLRSGPTQQLDVARSNEQHEEFAIAPNECNLVRCAGLLATAQAVRYDFDADALGARLFGLTSQRNARTVGFPGVRFHSV
jgi:hypothetical protein